MKGVIKPVLTSCAAILLLLFSADLARACDCGRDATVDKEFARSEDVVIAKLQSMDRPQSEAGLVFPGRPVPLAHLTVERVFKGKLKPGEELRFLQDAAGDCDREFYEDEVGGEFLLYLGATPARDGLRTVSMCSRSAWLGPGEYNQAPVDLLYLDKLAKVRGKTRISGRVWQSDDDPDTLPWLAGRTVRITGNGRDVRLKTDKNGGFEIYDLPPGNYRISPGKIAGHRLYRDASPDNASIDLKPGGQAEVEFGFEISTLIKGRLFDAGGVPIAGVGLWLEPAQRKPIDPGECVHIVKIQIGFGAGDICLDWKNFAFNTTTNADGGFEMTHITAGTYVMWLDVRTPESDPPGIFFYPGTKDRAAAATLTIEPGTTLDNLVIRLPEK